MEIHKTRGRRRLAQSSEGNVPIARGNKPTSFIASGNNFCLRGYVQPAASQDPPRCCRRLDVTTHDGPSGRS